MPSEAIRVAEEDTFAIELKGNPTTGYVWTADVDARYLELIGREFELEGEAIGAGGLEVFRFRARQAGQTEILFQQQRPWGGSAHDTRRFQIVIS